jgi:hypothetical protein
MSDAFHLKRGDTSPALRYVLDPATVDLSGAAVVFQWRQRGSATTFARAATVVTATGTPTVQHGWEAADTVTAGLFEGEFKVTFAGGAIETYPNEGFIDIRINEDVA